MNRQNIIDAAFKDGVFNAKMASASRNKELINELEKVHGKFDTVSELIYVAMNGISDKVCECGKKTAFLSFMKGYRDFCSAECASSSKKVKEKRLNSIESTCVERYGVKSTLAVEEVRQKSASTMVSRYGADNFAKTELHRAKTKETCLSRYGVDHPLKATAIRKQIASTMQEKFGGFTTESAELNAKMRSTMMSRYGAESSWSSSILLPKLHEIQLQKFINRVQQEFDIINLTSDFVKVKHECGHEFNLGLFEKLRCPGCCGQSKPEKELFSFVSSLGFECLRNDRKIIAPKELDIVIPEKNIAIEMNGVYWHHDESGKISLLEKSMMAEKAGVQVIHIWDYEWSEKQSIIKSILRSKLGRAEQKLNARQCEVREIDLQASSEFLETYHLQGSCRSSLKLGLFFKNELVGVATFGKPRFEKFEGLELLRMCFKENVSVRGGVSKLMSFVNGPILTYADARFSNGAGYLAAGFNYVMQTQPGYSWFHPRFGIVTRYESMKSKLPELLGESFDPNVTEDENMRRNKFIKLLDCGNNKLVRL